MDAPCDWPPSLCAFLTPRLGEPVRCERLGGMSVARVWRASGPGGSAIVKATPRPAEPAFYRTIAPDLSRTGVASPNLIWHGEAGGLHWLAIEDVPEPFPFPEGPEPAGDAILTTLARLHAATRGQTLEFPPHAYRGWQAEATDAALSWFEPDVAAGMEKPLARLRAAAGALDDPWCWISGDPSPPNWGRRADGTPVLYDWELFRPGKPATDLAITVRGLPLRDDVQRTAERYLACCTAIGFAIPWSAADLARDMAAAKVGTVVALMAAQAGGNANVPASYIANLVATVPPWVAALTAEL